MSLDLTKENLLEYAKRYDLRYFQGGENETEKEVKEWLQQNRYLDKDNFMKICLWKSRRPKRQYEKNSDELVKEIARFSLETKSEEAKIKTLMCLDGVSFPVASTILHFAFPDKYTIMDFRAIWSLGWEQPKNYTFSFWEKYYTSIQKIANDFNISVRDVDKALWQYSKENQENK